MKNLSLFILFALAATASKAQSDASAPKSPAELFDARKSAIIEKRYDEVGKMGNLNVQVEYLTDITAGNKLQCIRFDIQMENNPNGPYALLDTNEVNELLSFIKYVTANVTNRPPVDPNTEFNFTTKYDVQVGCYWKGNNGWLVFIRTDSQDASTEVDFGQRDVNGLIALLRDSKSQLQKQ